jgi:hypothetical protein
VGKAAGDRRQARRRPAGPSRPNLAANDDAPSIGGLIFALHQKPSRRPLQIAAIASGVWLLIGVLLGWAMLAPELQRAPTFGEMLTRPTAITLAATVVIPIALFWLLAILARRAQELRLMSSAMTEVAIRLAEPDRMAEQQIASVGQAVRRQVSFMDGAVARALGRAGEIEALVHNEVANLERSYAHNEQRLRALLQDLSGERNALLNTSERVNVALRELGSEIPSLVEKLGEQQIKLARFIQDAGQNLVALETTMSASTNQLASAVGARTEELNTVLTSQAQALDATMLARGREITGHIADGTERIAGALDEQARRLIEGTQNLEATLEGQAQRVQTVLTERTGELQALFDGFSGGLDEALGARTEGLQAVLEEYTLALDAALANREEALGGLLATKEQNLDRMLAVGQQGIEAVMTGREQALSDILSSRRESFEAQLIERTRALDEAFSARLKVFDDSIVRSTVAVDSMVADKARALSAALEAHAREIGAVLGRHAGELDEQLMHGVNAVRRASENVTRQSIQAIEGLANQADLLKNVSESLVNQISGVTGRFDQQGQTIMRAASALETANLRIDRTLQSRQVELTETLEQLATKTAEIDRTIRNYPQSLDGAFSEAEERAKLVGEAIGRVAEERSKAVRGELERLETTAASETERALADLRSRYANVTREVSEEIGTLNTRFTESSEEMRRRAQRTLAEIDSEQSRVREQLERLPEATRASAETMRSSLQEQLKALEQLSALSTREGRRDVSPPLSLPSAQPHPRAQEPASARSISTLTQSLASEMASRNWQSTTAAPSSPVPPSAPATLGPKLLPQPPQALAGSAPSPMAVSQSGSVAPASASSMVPPAGGYPVSGAAFPAAPGSGREGWKLGDLLARASEDDEAGGPAHARPGHATSAGSPAGAGQAATTGIDTQAIASALDATTASAIWSRFRAGQRGIMVRSIYTNDGKLAFDEVQRRIKVDGQFRQTLDRYIADFEALLREADQHDPSGRQAQSYVVMDTGRVYLFLAHATGRLL